MKHDAASEFENLSSQDLENTLEALKKQLIDSETEKENEATYQQAIRIAKILFTRQPADFLTSARQSVNDVLKRKDELLKRENEFEKMSPASIAKWKVEKYGGRTSNF